jgi:hypothetical protein
MKARMETIDPSDQLWDEILKQSLEDLNGPELGPAARSHLDHGRAVYYSDDAYPGETIKHYPDGHREIVEYDNNFGELFVRNIP